KVSWFPGPIVTVPLPFHFPDSTSSFCKRSLHCAEKSGACALALPNANTEAANRGVISIFMGFVFELMYGDVMVLFCQCIAGGWRRTLRRRVCRRALCLLW